nr:ATP-dependent DNA helicase PIF1-like [Ipomoea batatas]
MIQDLIIDEISLISRELYDKLEFIAHKIPSINGSEEMVWGDIQVVQSFNTQIDLTTVFRQSDPQLVKVLQGIRRGSTFVSSWLLLFAEDWRRRSR